MVFVDSLDRSDDLECNDLPERCIPGSGNPLQYVH